MFYWRIIQLYRKYDPNRVDFLHFKCPLPLFFFILCKFQFCLFCIFCFEINKKRRLFLLTLSMLPWKGARSTYFGHELCTAFSKVTCFGCVMLVELLSLLRGALKMIKPLWHLRNYSLSYGDYSFSPYPFYLGKEQELLILIMSYAQFFQRSHALDVLCWWNHYPC